MNETDRKDGTYIYRQTDDRGTFAHVRFVKNGRYSSSISLTTGELYASSLFTPVDSHSWERIGDLPYIPMPEPVQVGHPVMSGCGRDSSQHLHTRTLNRHYPWRCVYGTVSWDNLVKPRDLTPGEILRFNLWSRP